MTDKQYKITITALVIILITIWSLLLTKLSFILIDVIGVMSVVTAAIAVGLYQDIIENIEKQNKTIKVRKQNNENSDRQRISR